MKKGSIVCALALAFAIGLTLPIVSPTHAACAGICTDSVAVGKERLAALANAVRQQVMNEDDANYMAWYNANHAISHIEHASGNQSATELKSLVEAAGGDVSDWGNKTLPEVVAIAESTPNYATNEELKAKTAAVQSEIDQISTTLKTYLNTPDSTLTAPELVAQVKASAAYTKYGALNQAWQNATGVISTPNADPSMIDLSVLYDQLYNAAFDIKNNLDLSSVDAVLGNGGSSKPSEGTTEGTPSNSELQELVDRYRKDETFLKYEKLVIAVDEAQMVLDGLQESQDAKIRALSSSGAEIAVAISNIGDAMRNLGSNTTLGQNIVDPTADDLRNAIGEAKAVPEYAKYEELVRTIWEAENALRNGDTDAAALSNLLNKVQKAVANLAAPTTGAQPGSKADGTATWSNSILGGLIVIMTAAGAALVAKRQIARLNKQKQLQQ